jgi:hypothetical protein
LRAATLQRTLGTVTLRDGIVTIIIRDISTASEMTKPIAGSIPFKSLRNHSYRKRE